VGPDLHIDGKTRLSENAIEERWVFLPRKKDLRSGRSGEIETGSPEKEKTIHIKILKTRRGGRGTKIGKKGKIRANP